MQTYFLFVPALLYLVCAALPSRYRVSISMLAAFAWLLHGSALWGSLFAHDALRVGFAMMLSATLWVSVGAYWIENRSFALDGLRRLVMPCAAVAVLLPCAFPGSVVHFDGNGALFGWHIAIALLAYSTLTVAAFHAVLMALQESGLHTRRARASWMSAALDQLPALLTMERLLFRMIGLGFILLTLTVLSGIVFSEQLFARVLTWDHKSVFTLLSWLLFGALLVGRRWRGWRGKTALSLVLAGFTTLLLGYVGSRFVLEVILQRGGV